MFAHYHQFERSTTWLQTKIMRPNFRSLKHFCSVANMDPNYDDVNIHKHLFFNFLTKHKDHRTATSVI